LDIAKRLVVEAEAMVARQRQLVAALDNGPRNTKVALALLDNFEKAQINFKRSLALLMQSWVKPH
jgi:hypothetical protein